MANNERDERRAAALRANLRRRKGQARESAAAVATGDATEADIAATGQGDQPMPNDPVA
ncbi:hypothetical protein [Sphingomonas sp. CFBP 8760]|uniref:hypothetical protein n=1 Tax=Sphingomonas sp. CFBP 8760 TaxID=2775282 RepID=UPI0017838643|nr:hypothetical protein [Sphingomonas sp. CFBP 8760]MBD8547175.1 hypothetical protein [Sphingomonas sp. CFBP 8760]